jgi:predicted 3-demethylubiquinone-9 3-methyltransferase (glyoxalase superfamily)
MKKITPFFWFNDNAEEAVGSRNGYEPVSHNA